MDNISFSKNLQDRFLSYSKAIYKLIRKLPKDKIHSEYADQLNRCSCSIGANYIEAIEGESKKDFFHRIKICRKESKESGYWLDLISEASPGLDEEIVPLRKEIFEYIRLFTSILSKQLKN